MVRVRPSFVGNLVDRLGENHFDSVEFHSLLVAQQESHSSRVFKWLPSNAEMGEGLNEYFSGLLRA